MYRREYGKSLFLNPLSVSPTPLLYSLPEPHLPAGMMPALLLPFVSYLYLLCDLEFYTHTQQGSGGDCFGADTKKRLLPKEQPIYPVAEKLLGNNLYLNGSFDVFVAFYICIVDTNLLKFGSINNGNVSSVNLKTFLCKSLSNLNVVN